MSEKAERDKSVVNFALLTAGSFLEGLRRRKANTSAQFSDARLLVKLQEFVQPEDDEFGILKTELAMLYRSVRSRDTQSLDRALFVLNSVLELMQTESRRPDLGWRARQDLLLQIKAVQKALHALKVVRFPSLIGRGRQKMSFLTRSLRAYFRKYWCFYILLFPHLALITYFLVLDVFEMLGQVVSSF